MHVRAYADKLPPPAVLKDSLINGLSSANPQKGTMSLALCHSKWWWKSKVLLSMQSHATAWKLCATNQSTIQPSRHIANLPATMHVLSQSHTHVQRELNAGAVNGAPHTLYTPWLHAHMRKLDFTYQPHNFILMYSYKCHTHAHMLEIMQCAFTSAHTCIGSHA